MKLPQNGFTLLRAYQHKSRFLPRRMRCAAIISALVVVTCAKAVAQQDGSYSEAALRAAILINLPKFITWPATLGAPDKLCIEDAKDVQAALEALLERDRTENRDASLIIEASSNDDCSFLYAGDGRQIKHDIADKHGLVVSSDTGNASALIQLILRNDRIVIKVDIDRLKQRGFTVDARLLQLAEPIKR